MRTFIISCTVICSLIFPLITKDSFAQNSDNEYMTQAVKLCESIADYPCGGGTNCWLYKGYPNYIQFMKECPLLGSEWIISTYCKFNPSVKKFSSYEDCSREHSSLNELYKQASFYNPKISAKDIEKDFDNKKEEKKIKAAEETINQLVELILRPLRPGEQPTTCVCRCLHEQLMLESIFRILTGKIPPMSLEAQQCIEKENDPYVMLCKETCNDPYVSSHYKGGQAKIPQ